MAYEQKECTVMQCLLRKQVLWSPVNTSLIILRRLGVCLQCHPSVPALLSWQALRKHWVQSGTCSSCYSTSIDRKYWYKIWCRRCYLFNIKLTMPLDWCHWIHFLASNHQNNCPTCPTREGPRTLAHCTYLSILTRYIILWYLFYSQCYFSL